MKFGKEFAAQMIQEWQEAYMDYRHLKKVLKDILHFRKKHSSPSPTAATTSKGKLKRRVSLYRTFSGLTSRINGRSPKGNEDEVILVSAVQGEGIDSTHYQTMFLMSAGDEGENELLFFRRLDVEFNKVLDFYKKKVEEAMGEARELSEQMNALIAFRIKVDDPVFRGAKMTNLANNGVLGSDHPSRTGQSNMETIQEVEMSSESVSEEGEQRISKSDHIQGFRPAPLEVLDHVKINISPDTPVSTVKTILNCFNSGVSYSKKELKMVESIMMRALVEFYQKLLSLKSYCFLNQLAFSKIMKKYDKITSRNASKEYLRMVDNSYLSRSDEITKLMERVEVTFVKHFASGNRRKGMAILRPNARRERHKTTYFFGFFSGGAIALIVAIFVLLHARDVFQSAGRTQYMDNIFPLYSLFGFIALHMVMYAGNVYFWKRYRVNYSFIFGFKQGTELGYREVLLLSSGLVVLTFAGVLSNLDMEMDPRTESFMAATELVPLGLLTLVLLITFCPFNIIYCSSRFFLIRSAFHCICAPFYKVTLPDFFLADQLTSQVQAFRSLEFYICYYGWGDFMRRSNTCQASDIYEAFNYVVTIIPYWLRFLQCFRRLLEEKERMHALNGLKYMSTIIAVAAKTGYELNKTMTWKTTAIVTCGVATVVNTYWDIVIDWGLLQRNSRNPWLRDKLLVPNKIVYFVAMVLNVVLRLAWMQTVLGFTEAPFLHRTALIAIVASLEIIRRGLWNFFRLENEHLNNVGKYRAFKSVPLPFNYDDREDKM
ncbi:EXS family protein isoform 1 [Tripterygium wilfordii]|uniref:EXS family protein isoform 1 n=1 Tax=Tripterygium wilfordii TaxID=458696 RepID=A0A7J7DS42_TRIWF|nr:phosphate transporter PHO1 homolog 9-like [Tripterygium wilfordii]XP_038699308.1 phosphate transporter PHO1 homolog 9-like [Tripterygium wilfordii]XP_038699309.1 phosphate transporter PHO1 homolog 9-like [Tripterygium wilfordii]XP_038699310.1 phosphate transporter PHO1 homolog 9-like [Tripterygium wilfordii]KAF5748964.1 EXS family protein isoform 1 [Tripterygium wilfordii]